MGYDAVRKARMDRDDHGSFNSSNTDDSDVANFLVAVLQHGGTGTSVAEGSPHTSTSTEMAVLVTFHARGILPC